MFFTFPRKKLYLIVFSRGISAKQLAKRGRCKLQEPKKAGILARNSHTSVAFDWTYHFSHNWKKDLSRLWLDVSVFFSRVKNIVRSSDWLELICVWRFFISFQWVYLSIYIHCTGGTWHCIIINNYCIPRARMGSEWIAHEGERNNCFSKIQLVGKKYRDKTT